MPLLRKHPKKPLFLFQHEMACGVELAQQEPKPQSGVKMDAEAAMPKF
jgi:hypothetical protein